MMMMMMMINEITKLPTQYHSALEDSHRHVSSLGWKYGREMRSQRTK